MNDQRDSHLLRAYVERRSEPAFAELVRRHVDFVYSAALRLVCDAHLAEDVTQGAFVALAKNAPQLLDRPALSGWLHRTSQNIAAQTVRSEVRRRAREQEAAAMNELLSTPSEAVWEHIAPHLDTALGDLNESDRDAVLLRYFEHKSAREMADILGVSDEAAQKRVSRAVERLREFFAKRGIAVGAGGLVAVISANAVQAAPVGLAISISTVATAAGTTLAATATATVTKTIAMTTLQKTLVTTTVAVLAGVGIYEARQVSQLRDQIQTLRKEQVPLAEQIRQMQSERDEAARQLAALRDDNERLSRSTTELPRLRGEVSRLREATRELARTQPAADAKETDVNANDLKSLLARATQLKERLRQSPDQSIPELQLLTHSDWLDAAEGKLENEADYRRALARLRSSAKDHFAALAVNALKQYLRANNGQFPANLTQLKPYFASPADDAMLARYEILPAESVSGIGLGGDKIVSERAAVDDDYDRRQHFGASGGRGATSFKPSPFDTLFSVARAFSAANNGQEATDPAQLAPYIKTPAQQAALQAVADAISAYKQANGQAPRELTELQPFLKPQASATP